MCQFLAFLTLFETSSGISDFRSIHNSSVHPFIVLFDSGQKQGTRTGLIWELFRKIVTLEVSLTALHILSLYSLTMCSGLPWLIRVQVQAQTHYLAPIPLIIHTPSLPSHTWLSSWSSSKSLVGYPIRWSLLFIIGFLYGSSISSSSKQQRNIVQLCTTTHQHKSYTWCFSFIF